MPKAEGIGAEPVARTACAANAGGLGGDEPTLPFLKKEGNPHYYNLLH